MNEVRWVLQLKKPWIPKAGGKVYICQKRRYSASPDHPSPMDSRSSGPAPAGLPPLCQASLLAQCQTAIHQAIFCVLITVSPQTLRNKAGSWLDGKRGFGVVLIIGSHLDDLEWLRWRWAREGHFRILRECHVKGSSKQRKGFWREKGDPVRTPSQGQSKWPVAFSRCPSREAVSGDEAFL